MIGGNEIILWRKRCTTHPKNEVLAGGVSPKYKREGAAHSELQFVKFLILIDSDQQIE